MVQVLLIIDLVTPGVGRRRAERMTALPGVPAVGQWIDTGRKIGAALTVTGVRWHAVNGTVLAFLGAGTSQHPGITDHDGEIEVPDYFVDDLRDAGWDVGEYE